MWAGRTEQVDCAAGEVAIAGGNGEVPRFVGISKLCRSPFLPPPAKSSSCRFSCFLSVSPRALAFPPAPAEREHQANPSWPWSLWDPWPTPHQTVCRGVVFFAPSDAGGAALVFFSPAEPSLPAEVSRLISNAAEGSAEPGPNGRTPPAPPR